MASDSFLLKARVRYSPDVSHWTDVHGFVYISPFGKDIIYKLDGISALLWTKFSSRPVGKVVQLVAKDLQLSSERLEADTLRFVKKLIRMQLLVTEKNSK